MSGAAATVLRHASNPLTAAVWKSRLPRWLKLGVAGYIASCCQDDGRLRPPMTLERLTAHRYWDPRSRTYSRLLGHRQAQRQCRLLELIGFLLFDPTAVASRSRPREYYGVKIAALDAFDPAVLPPASRSPKRPKDDAKGDTNHDTKGDTKGDTEAGTYVDLDPDVDPEDPPTSRSAPTQATDEPLAPRLAAFKVYCAIARKACAAEPDPASRLEWMKQRCAAEGLEYDVFITGDVLRKALDAQEHVERNGAAKAAAKASAGRSPPAPAPVIPHVKAVAVLKRLGWVPKSMSSSPSRQDHVLKQAWRMRREADDAADRRERDAAIAERLTWERAQEARSDDFVRKRES